MDKKTDPEVMFLVGLTLSALTVSTSDASFAGSAGGGKVRGSQEHKVVEVKQLAMYWNPHSHPLGASLEATDNQIISVLRREEDTPDKVVYLLRPTDVTLKLLLNKNMTGEEGVAQYAVVVNVDDLSLALEDLQLRGMLLLFDAISIARAREKYGRFRPQANEGEGGGHTEWKKQLWQYAIDAVLSDVRKTLWRRSLGYIVWRRAYRERYVDLYIDKLENLQRGQPSGEEESAELEEIERQFEMDEILFFRSLAERKMPLEDIFGNAALLEDESGGGAEGPTAADLLTPQPVLQQKGWLNWLSLGLLGTADRPDAGQIFPQEIIKDLYEAAQLHPMPMLESGESSKGQCQLAITLHVGELLGSLHSSKLGQDILNISVQGIAVTAQMWPEKTTMSVMVRTLEAVDLCTPGTRFPRILAPWGKLTPRASQRKPARRSYAEALAGSGLVRSVSDGSMSTLQGSLTSDEDGSAGEKSEPLLRVEVELQPKRSDHDLTITVVLQPVEFVYSSTLIKRASSFFSFPASHEVLNDQVDSALKKLEDVAVTNFKHKVVERKRLRLLLDIRRPNFLFPESNLTSNGILMILAVDSIILASQELRHALEDTSSKGLSRTAILRRHIGIKHGIFPSTQGQNGRNQDAGDIPLDKCGHYDRFQLRLTGAQVLISGKSGDWHETLNSHESDMEWHLIKRFSLQVAIDIVVKDNHLLPRLKIHGNLPALRLHFSLRKCRAVNDLLTKLLDGGQLNKGALHTGASEKHPRVAEVMTLFTWEMSLKLNVVTVELSLDSERHDSSMETEKKTLVAQGQEMTIKYIQRSSHADLELLLKTVHVEDASELASSPFRYLLYCAGCHRSITPLTPVVHTNPVSSKSAESFEDKYAACLKMVMDGPMGVPKMGIMAALHGLEFHINPIVFRALHGFAMAATAPKTSASSGTSPTLTTISDASPNGFPPDFHSLDEYYMDGKETGLCSVFSGLPIKSPMHNQMQAIALSPTSPSHPSSTSNVNTQDAGNNEGETTDNLFLFFEKLSSQLLPLSAMFQNQVARNDSIIIDVQLESCGVQFLDAGGTVGVLLLPDATVCTSVPCTTSSGEESWEIVVVSSDLQLKGTHWASGNIKENPVGSLGFGPSATWDVRVRKSENGNLDVVIQIHNAQVVLLADYLAGLIQYFDSSRWTSQSKSNSKTAGKSSTICWKVEVEDSVLFLPREQSKDEFLQLVLGEFLFTAMDDHNPTTSYYVVGQKVSIRVHGTNDDADDQPETEFGKSCRGQTLVQRWDGEMLIEIPPDNLPTCLEIHSSVLELILDGNALEEQAEAFQSISQDLSAIEWTSNTMALTTVHGGLASWIPGKYVHVNSPSTGSLNLKFCALKLCVTFATPDPGSKSLLPVAVLQLDSLDVDISLNRGILEALALEVLSIVLFQHNTKLKLLQCKGGEELAMQPALKLLVNSEGPESEVHISLPSTQVWLHIAAWSEIGPVIAASLKQSKPQNISGDSGSLDPSTGSSKTLPKVEILVLQEDLDYASSLRQDTDPITAGASLASSSVSKSQQSKNAAVLVKVGTFRLALLVLDSPSNAQNSERIVEDVDPSLQQKTLPGKLLSCTLALRVDEFRFNKDGTWALAAGITQGEGNVVEIFEDQDPFQELCFQATELSVSVHGSFQQSPIVRFDLKVNAECINFWCSYPILRFFREFTFEELEAGPSSSLDIEGNAEICLQHASILLSDGRWSCKAPIMELLMGNIIAHANYCVQRLEASLSADLEANYHNMHKVSWEPVVEPWSVNSAFTVQNAIGATKSHDCTRIKVSSSANLNINITESLVQATSRAAEMAHDAWSDDSMARDTRLGISSQYAPYWLQNDTGVAITYWLIGSRHNRDEMDDVDGGFGGWGSRSGTVVEPGKSVALYQQGSVEEISCRKRNSGLLSSTEPAKMFEVLLQHRMICVQIEGTSRPSPPLSIDLVGSRSFEASFSENESGDGYNPSGNNTPGNISRQNSFQKLEADNRDKGDVFRTPVVFEVTIQRYSKLVRLCSTVSVVNMIAVPLEVRFDIPFTISPKVMEPVLPGQVMPLPVHLAQTGKIRWRPLGNNYVWSEVQSIKHLLQSSESLQGLHRPVLCYPSSRTSRPFRCCLSVSHSPIAGVDSSFGELTQDPLEVGRVSMGRPKEFKLWDITLQAPLVVKNCLPLPVLITIDSATGSIVSHTAPEGDSKFVYDVDTVHDLSVTFRVRGFVTSNATVMQAAQSIAESSRRTDREGRIKAFETVNFFPEIMSDPVVAAEVEFTINMISGTREICISVPFWLYNCSSFNLAVIDGDVDAFSGRQKYLAKVPTEGADKEKQQTDIRPGLASLQTGEQQAGEISFGWFPKRGARLISQRTTSSDRKLIDCKESTSSKGENLDDYWGLLVPHMYSPVKGTESSEHRFRARVVHPVHMETRNSIEQSWSRPFSVDIPDGTTTVTVPRPQNQGAYVFSVICNPVLGSGAGKSKTVTFRPRFLLANSCKRDLCVKQQGTDAFERLPVGQHCHLHWTDMTRALLVSVRFSDHGWDWSGGFAPDKLGDTQVKVRNHTSGTTQMLRVEVSTMAPSDTNSNKGVGPGTGNLGTCLILLSDDETGFMPYRIDNFSMERIRFHQQKCEKMENMLHPYSSFCYAWDEPCDPHRLVLEIPGGGPLGVYGLDEVKEYSPITLLSTSQKPERTFLVSVRAEGPIRVLSIADTSLHLMKSPSESSSVFASNQPFATPGSRILESTVTDTESVKELIVNFSHIGVSLIDSVPQEIIFACAKGLSLQLTQGQHQQQVKLDIAVIQVDNQLRFAVYPVLLSSTYPHTKLDEVDNSARVGKDLKPSEGASLSLLVAKWRHPAGSVDCFQCISVRLVPIRLEVEEQVVSSLLSFMDKAMESFPGIKMDKLGSSKVPAWSLLRWNRFNGQDQFAGRPWKFEVVQVSTIQSGDVRFRKVVKRLEEYQCWAAAAAVEPVGGPHQKLPLLAKEKSKAYIEMLHISPIELTVSFSSTPWLSNQAGATTKNSLLWMTGMMLQHHVMAIADAEDAVMNLRRLTLAHPLASWDAIRGMITRHYTRQLLQEIYKVVGSADVLGNPIHFVRTLGSGMWDFVSTPAKSLKQSPRQLARGLVQGTHSLFSNTVFAFSNAATRMSKVARKTVTAFAFDKEYVNKMERREHLHGMEDLSVVNEFLEGLTGLLQSPVRGAERAGLPGMLSGAAVGALGVVARPVASILEVASKTGQSIVNRSSPKQWRATRIRLPRHLREDSPLLPYSWESAVGRAVLLETDGGCFRNEVLVLCLPLAHGNEFVLLTQTRILKVSSVKVDYLSGFKWHMELVAAVEDILHMDHVENRVNVLLGPARREFVRTQHYSGLGHRVMSLPAHETLEFLDESALEQFIGVLRFLEDRLQHSRSTILISTRTL
ncbi:hypothetical protein M758_10G186100 [Ceratodon purpureus]|nr:hypothetical protein M758_10G186100 [Ceratodon purpureus]KAG0604648.1 hypothetical protein M758_10G186100 [Ceratodon purpureus]